MESPLTLSFTLVFVDGGEREANADLVGATRGAARNAKACPDPAR